jgi:hypothetical protein
VADERTIRQKAKGKRKKEKEKRKKEKGKRGCPMDKGGENGSG